MEEIEDELDQFDGPVLVKVDVSNPELETIQEFYGVKEVPYLILMKNYELLYEGAPDPDRVEEVLIREHEVRTSGVAPASVVETAETTSMVEDISENEKTVVEERIEGGVKKIITTNT